MKKILLLISIICVTSACYAQKGAVGLRGGISLTNYYGNDVDPDSVTTKMNYTGGIYINTMVSKFFWLKHDIFYVNRKNEEVVNGRTIARDQHYVDIYPLMPALHIYGLQAFAGPSFSFLAALKEEDVSVSSSGTVSIDPGDRKLVEFGVVGGLAFEFKFGLNAGFRYVRGLSKIDQDINGQVQRDIKNEAFLFTLGWTFRSHINKSNKKGDKKFDY